MAKLVADHKKRENLGRETLRIYWQHARPYWPTMVFWVAAVIVVVGCDVALPIFYKRFFDQLALDPFRQEAQVNLIEVYNSIILIGIVLVTSWVGWRTCSFMMMRLESRVMKSLMDYAFEHLQNHSHRFFTDTFAGALVKRVHRFSAGFEIIADQCTLELGQTSLRIILIVGVIFWRNTTLGFVFLGWTIAFVCFSLFYARWKLQFDLRKAELDTHVTAQLADTITNSVNLKLFASIAREVSKFCNLTDLHRQARYLSWKMGWYSDTIQGASTRILEISTLLLAMYYWKLGLLTIGDFFLFRSYLSKLNDDVRQVGQYVRRIYEAMADANEMTAILIQPHEVRDDEQAGTLSTSKGAVEFRNVQFSYGGGRGLVIKDFSLRTRAGERVGIVGPSGGGKSTILKLLVRLYDINGGEILIDNQVITMVTQHSLRQNIAFVPQDPTLFHRPIFENIQYARPDATEDEVIEAAQLAHCHGFISAFPDGYKTLVGERGIKLSGGERQRVAIARAILMNAPILVLDEATSSLDSESEALIQDSLSRLMVNRTVIAVAHRLSTIQRMDRIVVVEDGHITEEGSHAILMKLKDGTYQRLWNLQTSQASGLPLPDRTKTGEYIQ